MTYDLRTIVDQERIDEIMAETAVKIENLTERLVQMALKEIRETCLTVEITETGE